MHRNKINIESTYVYMSDQYLPDGLGLVRGTP